MDQVEVLSCILDAIPYPIVFADCDHIIRFMNKRARYHYYEERGYRDLVGRSLLDCHSEDSRAMLREAIERFQNHGKEEFLKVNARNERAYVTPVRDHGGNLIGYFERFENNFVQG